MEMITILFDKRLKYLNTFYNNLYVSFRGTRYFHRIFIINIDLVSGATRPFLYSISVIFLHGSEYIYLLKSDVVRHQVFAPLSLYTKPLSYTYYDFFQVLASHIYQQVYTNVDQIGNAFWQIVNYHFYHDGIYSLQDHFNQVP